MISDERTKLRTLLNYLVEHNQEHSQEIRDWAHKASIMGDVRLAEGMLQAAKAMDNASMLLYESLKTMEEK